MRRLPQKLMQYVTENDLLSIAESVPVDFIVSGDNDLIDLGTHADIPILKYANFVSMLSAMEKGNN